MKLLRIFTNRWFLGVLGLTAIGLLIWYAGPLLGFGESRPLESAVVRIATIVVLVVLWLIKSLIREVRRTKVSNQLATGIIEQQATPAVIGDSVETVSDNAKMAERFDEAISTLRKTRGKGGRFNLYELPWYVIIGPPGSGKTTALRNSGLRFPLADKFGDEALRGVGGTRNCDWWFTDEAILLDTAGRFTTQDSDAAADQTEWLGFLDLLKKYRKRRPVNGVLLSISLADVLQLSPTERRAQIKAIRLRIQELYERSGMRVPVYVILTKADLLAGFAEYFEELSAAEREQVWGFTFPIEEADAATSMGRFAAEFDDLIKRLNDRVMAKLDRERDSVRRSLVYGFPAQVANVKPLLESFLGEVFAGNAYESAPFLRGVYLTSGTQEGSPIDRLMGKISRNFGLNIDALPAFRGEGRSYFIARLLKKVVFAESELAGTDRKVERRMAFLNTGVYAVAGVLALAVLGGWVFSFLNNQKYVEDTTGYVIGATELVDKITIHSDLLNEVVPALDAVRNIPGGYSALEQGTPLTMGLGLYQGDRVGEQATRTYQRLLREQLLPRMMLELEDQLRRGGDNGDYLYEGLKRYLMLDSKAHFDGPALGAWFRGIWSQEYSRRATPAQLESLFSHLDVLFSQRTESLPLALDETLIERTRRVVLRTPVSLRAYERLKRIPSQDLPGFSIARATGSEGRQIFESRSGRSLNDEIPALFTRDGYLQLFLTESGVIAKRLREEAWVLGEEQGLQELDAGSLVAEITALYHKEYSAYYEDLLADLALVPFGDPAQAARVLGMLSSATSSPLKQLVAAVQYEVDLDNALPGSATMDKLSEKVATAQRELNDIFGNKAKPNPSSLPIAQASVLARKFTKLKELVPEEGEGPLDRLLVLLDELYVFMEQVARDENRGGVLPNVASAGEQTIVKLELETKYDNPDFLVSLVNDATSQASDIAFGGVTTYINNAWRGKPAQFCREAIAGRYPIKRGSNTEMRLEDFSAFFAAGGVMDTFFQEYLSDYVDTSVNPWRVRASRSNKLALNPQALRQFQRADRIRQMFFRNGSTPSVTFEMTPYQMDSVLRNFALDLEGQKMTYSFGPKISTTLTWPGASASGVALRMMPTGPSGRDRVVEVGPWAWFRVLDQANLRKADRPEHFLLDFALDGRTVTYELVARSAFNPFSGSTLDSFSCPTGL